MMIEHELKDEPLVYMWIAHFSDGQSLPQFDLQTGEENRYSEIDDYLKKKNVTLIKLGWYPLFDFVADKLTLTQPFEVRALPFFELAMSSADIEPQQFRRNSLKYSLGKEGARLAKRYYVLGFKKHNEYSLMFIDANGNCELSSEYNYK